MLPHTRCEPGRGTTAGTRFAYASNVAPNAARNSVSSARTRSAVPSVKTATAMASRAGPMPWRPHDGVRHALHRDPQHRPAIAARRAFGAGSLGSARHHYDEGDPAGNDDACGGPRDAISWSHAVLCNWRRVVSTGETRLVLPSYRQAGVALLDILQETRQSLVDNLQDWLERLRVRRMRAYHRAEDYALASTARTQNPVSPAPGPYRP